MPIWKVSPLASSNPLAVVAPVISYEIVAGQLLDASNGVRLPAGEVHSHVPRSVVLTTTLPGQTIRGSSVSTTLI